MEIEELTIALKNAKNNKDILTSINDNSERIKKLNIIIREKNINEVNNSKTLKKIQNSKYCQVLIFTIEKLIEQEKNKIAKTLLKDILISRDQNQGKFFEMMTYYCLLKNEISFKPQVHIESENCFKDSEYGYDADGEILGLSCVFDVKEYGIGFPHIKNFEMKLQKQVNQLFDMKIKSFLEESQKNINMLEEEKHNQATIDSEVEEKLDCEKRKKDRMDIESKSGLWKYTVSVDGLSNMGMDELSNQIESVGDVAKVLVDKAWEERINKWEDYTTWNDDNPIVKHGSGFFREHIDGLGITCTLESVFSEEIRGTFHIETYEINIYEWAMNNKFYFMGDASQFVNNKPYVIICVLDKSDNLFLGNVNQYDSYFRPLCRRIFIELNSMTNRDIKTSFDGKARVGYSISEAVKKITGIIFLEITELIDEKNDDTPMWIYLNPNADNPLLDFQIFQLKLMKPKTVEDYEYDNY